MSENVSDEIESKPDGDSVKKALSSSVDRIVTGALPSPECEDDFVFENTAMCNGIYLAEMPEEFDLRPHTYNCRDQGARGTCAAFASSALKEIYHLRRGNSDDVLQKGYFSPEFIYSQRRNRPSHGMYGRDVFTIMKNIGAVPETMYPYKDTDLEAVYSRPSKDLIKEAGVNRIAEFARVRSINGLKRALLEVGPCYLALKLYDSSEKFWLKKGRNIDAGHAVAVVGYNKTGFILRNSWGVDWGDSGYTVIPYEDYDDAVIECWVPINVADPDHETPLEFASRTGADVQSNTY